MGQVATRVRNEIKGGDPNPRDLLRQFGVNMYREAYQEGMTLSAWLERNFARQYEGYNDGLDVFQRLMLEAGLVTRAKPEIGLWPSRFEDFEQNDRTRLLRPEWMTRVWRRTRFAPMAQKRELYSSGDEIPGSLRRPYAEAQQLLEDDQLVAPIPITELTAMTTPVSSDAYRAVYLQRETEEMRLRRVAEGSEIPYAKLVDAERDVRLHKYGRALIQSYEQARRLRLDLIARHIALLSIQVELDLVSTAIDVLVNGDGNAGTAGTVVNLTALDSDTTAGNLTRKGWLMYKKQFEPPYMLNTMLAQTEETVDVELLDIGTANVLLAQLSAQFGDLTPINKTADNVRYGWTSEAPAQKLVGFDRRFALNYLTEIGGNIEEVERYATRQVETMTFTMVDGFSVLDTGAVVILDINA